MRTPPARRCRHSGLRVACVPVAGGTPIAPPRGRGDGYAPTSRARGSRFACVRDLAQHGALTPHGRCLTRGPVQGIFCEETHFELRSRGKRRGHRIFGIFFGRCFDRSGLVFGSLFGAVWTDGISESNLKPTKISIFLNFRLRTNF